MDPWSDRYFYPEICSRWVSSAFNFLTSRSIAQFCSNLSWCVPNLMWQCTLTLSSYFMFLYWQITSHIHAILISIFTCSLKSNTTRNQFFIRPGNIYHYAINKMQIYNHNNDRRATSERESQKISSTPSKLFNKNKFSPHTVTWHYRSDT